MLVHTCERHLIPANDAHLSPTNRHTKVYNHVFRRRSLTERRWATIWHWELPKKKQVGSLYKRIVYSIGIPNDLHLLVLIQRFTKTGVFWLWLYWRCQLVQASKNYTNRHSTSTGTGVQQVQAQAFDRYGRTVWTATGVQQKLYYDTYCSWLEPTPSHQHS